MSDKSAIEWTDATWNPTTGCDRVSPGCAHCYALDLAARLKRMGQPGYQADGDAKTSGPGFMLTLHEERLIIPFRWSGARRVFVDSMSDLFRKEGWIWRGPFGRSQTERPWDVSFVTMLLAAQAGRCLTQQGAITSTSLFRCRASPTRVRPESSSVPGERPTSTLRTT